MQKQKLSRAVTLAIALAVGGAVQAESVPQPVPSPVQPPDGTAKTRLDDATFVEKAAMGGMAEVELSKLALKKTSNDKLRQFAERMINDHESTQMKLKQVAQKHNVRVPAMIDAAHRKSIAELQGMSGEEFDRAYIKMMKQDHDTTVGLFDNAAGELALNKDFRDFATQTLPTLRMHQQHAHGLMESRDSVLPAASTPAAATLPGEGMPPREGVQAR